MTAQTTVAYQVQRDYRVVGHPVFAFTDNVPLKKLDAIMRGVSERMASPEVLELADYLIDAVKAKAKQRGQKMGFSRHNALEVLCRIGILMTHDEAT